LREKLKLTKKITGLKTKVGRYIITRNINGIIVKPYVYYTGYY